MRNRAKCALCKDIIESFHSKDYVSCSCDQISIYGGQNEFISYAVDFANFIRIDDQGKEIPVTIIEKEDLVKKESEKPSQQDLLKILSAMIEDIERLPDAAMRTPVNQYDHLSMLIMIQSLFSSFLTPEASPPHE